MNINENDAFRSKMLIAKAFYDYANRAYHNWDHVTWILDNIPESIIKNIPEYNNNEKTYVHPLSLIRNMKTAAIWHDVIYNPGASDNEEKSAQLYRQICKIGEFSSRPEEYTGDMVTRFILRTKDHLVEEGAEFNETIASEIFIDLDLHGLGSDWPTFCANGVKIMDECEGVIAFNLGNEALLKGRADFCKKMLSRDKIFLTSFYMDREKQARLNLEKELYQVEKFGIIANRFVIH